MLKVDYLIKGLHIHFTTFQKLTGQFDLLLTLVSTIQVKFIFEAVYKFTCSYNQSNMKSKSLALNIFASFHLQMILMKTFFCFMLF